MKVRLSLAMFLFGTLFVNSAMAQRYDTIISRTLWEKNFPHIKGEQPYDYIFRLKKECAEVLLQENILKDPFFERLHSLKIIKEKTVYIENSATNAGDHIYFDLKDGNGISYKGYMYFEPQFNWDLPRGNIRCRTYPGKGLFVSDIKIWQTDNDNLIYRSDCAYANKHSIARRDERCETPEKVSDLGRESVKDLTAPIEKTNTATETTAE